MTPPKKIYLQENSVTNKLDEEWHDVRFGESDTAYYSEEHIRAVANELYNNGDAFIAKLNGKSFSEYLKED